MSSSTSSTSHPPSSPSTLCNLFHCCWKKKLTSGFFSTDFLIEVVTITVTVVWPGGTFSGQLVHVVWFWTVFIGFKQWYFELQNVCKAENVFKVLETWEEVWSLCVRLNICAVHFTVLATGKTVGMLADCFSLLPIVFNSPSLSNVG